MTLQIEAKARNMVHPKQTIDYRAFEEKFRRDQDNELQTFEKFYAVRNLIEQGYSKMFVNVSLTVPDRGKKRQTILSADVCGESDDYVTVVFCETLPPTKELIEKLRAITTAENVKALIVYPFTIDATTLAQLFPEQFRSGQFIVEQVSWLNDEPEDIFENALDLVTLLGNRTRVRMLLPLLRESRRKSQFRMHVNPKLVYENISMLMSHRLVEEFTENEYNLTPIGRQIMGEYLAFLHTVQKILEKQEG